MRAYPVRRMTLCVALGCSGGIGCAGAALRKVLALTKTSASRLIGPTPRSRRRISGLIVLGPFARSSRAFSVLHLRARRSSPEDLSPCRTVWQLSLSSRRRRRWCNEVRHSVTGAEAKCPEFRLAAALQQSRHEGSQIYRQS